MNSIGIYEFSALEEKQKTKLIYSKGELITALEYEGEKMLLYFISDFFVEITFNDKGLTNIKAFKKGDLLEKYLDKIEINDFEN